jgi:hypothetical protein
LKPLKKILQRAEKPALVLLAAGLMATLVFIIYAIFVAIR